MAMAWKEEARGGGYVVRRRCGSRVRVRLSSVTSVLGLILPPISARRLCARHITPALHAIYIPYSIIFSLSNDSYPPTYVPGSPVLDGIRRTVAAVILDCGMESAQLVDGMSTGESRAVMSQIGIRIPSPNQATPTFSPFATRTPL